MVTISRVTKEKYKVYQKHIRGKFNIDYGVRKGFLEGVTLNLRPGECAGISQTKSRGEEERAEKVVLKQKRAWKSPKG